MTSKVETVWENIRASAKSCGRPNDDITLVVVSKTQEISAIIPILEQGQRVFGENRIQEAAGKWPALRAQYGDIDLHLIGPLQSNKVRQAIMLFDVIETIDRPKLARAVARISMQEGKFCKCYIQVNIGREPQKAGIDPDEADSLIALCRDEITLPISGLMCIPPTGHDPAPYFRHLKEIGDRHGLDNLSMGMSRDYQTAIRYGATVVRVGTAIFGTRTQRE